MTLLGLFGAIALIVLAFMAAIWVISLVLRDSSIVDVFWGAGFVLCTWCAFALAPAGFSGRKLLLAILVTVWGLRLSLHILVRNWGKGEDFRYVKWREENGSRWWWYSFFKVFLLQGALMWIISIPLLAAQYAPTPPRLTWIDWLAVPVWLLGFAFEAGGDLQLARFRAEPANKGRVLDTGFWRYTRHPNYFGDAVQWWAFYLVAVAAGSFWTIFSPVIMTGLLVRVSGVALLERTLKETKPAYRDYMETTSAFLPWLPRRK